jgi:flagellar protein FlaI
MTGEAAPSGSDDRDTAGSDSAETNSKAVGEYTWRDFMREYGYVDDIAAAYRDIDPEVDSDGLFAFLGEDRKRAPAAEDWERTDFDPATFLGFPPGDVPERLGAAAVDASALRRRFEKWVDATPVTKDAYTWEHFKWEYYYDESGDPPRDGSGEVEPFDPSEYLGFDPENIESVLGAGAEAAEEMAEIEEERTVYVNPELDEDEFFSTTDGRTTLVNRYDLEKSVPMDKKEHFIEVERYWVNEPFAFVIIFHSVKENEKKYYAVDPYLTDIEADLVEYFSGKLRTSIKYSDDDVVVEGSDEDRGDVLEGEVEWLLDRSDVWRSTPDGGGLIDEAKSVVGMTETPDDADSERELEGIQARPEPAILEEDPDWITDYQVEKLLYVIRRDFIGYERIDPIKHDINVEDISCDGYEQPVFVYHTDYENLITNIQHGETRLDNFVIKLAQRSGKGISKRQPQVDATLPDGSRAQLTLGTEVSDHGTNYTIRQFKDVPFTPVDLINWKTFSMDEMAFLWLCIESNKSLIFAGGTASGKTTSLNAVSLFIPSNAKIVSIEDTREVELPQRNWVASVTRPSFSQDNTGDIDEFDLLEAALRQRPDYIVMGEVRGEEGRTLFQVMSTGHTTYTTFHADNVDEVLKRFTTDPINVSKTLFTALDLVSVQAQTKVDGRKVRRNTMITEINAYDAENDEISVQDVYQWQPEDDEFLQHGDSRKLQEIAFDRGWSQDRLRRELFERRAVLSYLITNGLNTYTEVAATVQAYINDPETILTLMANDELASSLEDLREMESVLIDVDPEKEALVPRPTPADDVLAEAEAVLESAESRVFEEYHGRRAGSLVAALSEGSLDEDITAPPGIDREVLEAIASDGVGGTDESVSGGGPEADPDAEAGPTPDISADGGEPDDPDAAAGDGGGE